MIRRPPSTTRTDTRFPTRRSSDLQDRQLEQREAVGCQDGAEDHDGADRGGDDEQKQQQSPASRPGIGWRRQAHRWASAQGTMRTASQHRRSEEHTSELQSLMRISYAVICLKKKTTKSPPQK